MIFQQEIIIIQYKNRKKKSFSKNKPKKKGETRIHQYFSKKKKGWKRLEETIKVMPQTGQMQMFFTLKTSRKQTTVK